MTAVLRSVSVLIRNAKRRKQWAAAKQAKEKGEGQSPVKGKAASLLRSSKHDMDSVLSWGIILDRISFSFSFKTRETWGLLGSRKQAILKQSEVRGEELNNAVQYISDPFCVLCSHTEEKEGCK